MTNNTSDIVIAITDSLGEHLKEPLLPLANSRIVVDVCNGEVANVTVRALRGDPPALALLAELRAAGPGGITLTQLTKGTQWLSKTSRRAALAELVSSGQVAVVTTREGRQTVRRYTINKEIY